MLQHLGPNPMLPSLTSSLQPTPHHQLSGCADGSLVIHGHSGGECYLPIRAVVTRGTAHGFVEDKRDGTAMEFVGVTVKGGAEEEDLCVDA